MSSDEISSIQNFSTTRKLNGDVAYRIKGPGWLDLTHTSLSPIRRGFAPSFVNYKKVCTRLAAASDKAYQLLAHGRWFTLGTPASSTAKTCHDIGEIFIILYRMHLAMSVVITYNVSGDRH
jgi:hypothetical protein